MQTLANVLNRPIIVAESDYAPALGAAIYAAVAAGGFPNVQEASKVLGSKIEAEYLPDPDQVAALQPLMAAYNDLSQFIEETTKKKSNE